MADITITVTMNEDVALQLAQFCKRSTFDQFYDRTDAYVPPGERVNRAYQMRDGIEAVQRALSESGFSPR